MASVRNPVGVKVSAHADTDDLLRIIDKVDPEREPGRLTFITLHGGRPDPGGAPHGRREGDRVGRVGDLGLRPHARQHVRVRLRLQDPDFDDVVEEVEGFFEVHRGLGTVPGGIHVELTGNDVTEASEGRRRSSTPT